MRALTCKDLKLKIPRLLLAVNLPYLPIIQHALSDYDLCGATTILQAQRLLIEDGFDMCIISIHFDDSRAVELINFMSESKEHKNTPIIVLRLHASEHTALLKSTVDALKKTVNVCEYLEASKETELTTRLRQAVAKHLHIENYLLQQNH
ncbi:hypothetical protein BH11CYA1_BH11CYA1_29590 [soil metagenome]